MAQNKHLIISLRELLTEEKKVLSHGSSSQENTVRNWTSAPKHHLRNNRNSFNGKEKQSLPRLGQQELGRALRAALLLSSPCG